jgi:hypothetical protein
MIPPMVFHSATVLFIEKGKMRIIEEDVETSQRLATGQDPIRRSITTSAL